MSVSINTREAAPYPRLKQSNKKSSFETIRELPDRTRRFGKQALASAVGLGSAYLFVMSGQVEAEDDSCTDATHQQIVAEDGLRASVRSVLEIGGLIEGEQTAAGIAKTLTNNRGYSVSEAQLRAANKPGLFGDEKLGSGVYCIEVPGPVYAGFARTDGDMSLADLAASHLTTVENLHKLNPSLADHSPKESLKAGQVVRVDPTVDTGYFYREMSGEEADINTLADRNARLRNQILAKNGAILGTGGAVSAGSEAWLPAVETTWMQDNELRLRDIIQAFPISSYTRSSPEHVPSRSSDRDQARLAGFEAGFTNRVLKSVRTEAQRWPENQTDNWDGVENSNPYIAKYTGGALGVEESWCADFVRFALNKAGADIEVQEQLDGTDYYMRRVRDVYRWMTSGENGSFYVYKRSDITDNKKTVYRPGDVIFFNYHGSEKKFMASNGNHVGIISGVNGSRLRIIDGNYYKRDNVSERTLSGHDEQIIAIARPFEAKPAIGDIHIPLQEDVTPEQSRRATDALFERGPEWENRALAMRFFIDYGLEDYQAAGLVGNFVVETGNVSLPPDIAQYGGGPGRGIAQWEKGARFDELEAFADRLGRPWTDIETQLAFVVHEFETTERAAFLQLQRTPGVHEATDAVLNGYERPAARILPPRLIEAQKILAAYRSLAQR